MAQVKASCSAELGKLRHEAGVAENRVLAALSKQASLGQEQISRLQELDELGQRADGEEAFGIGCRERQVEERVRRTHHHLQVWRIQEGDERAAAAHGLHRLTAARRLELGHFGHFRIGVVLHERT